jgi:hypothetical protein
MEQLKGYRRSKSSAFAGSWASASRLLERQARRPSTLNPQPSTLNPKPRALDLGIEAAREAGQAMARHMRHQQQADHQVDEEEAKAVAGDVGEEDGGFTQVVPFARSYIHVYTYIHIYVYVYMCTSVVLSISRSIDQRPVPSNLRTQTPQTLDLKPVTLNLGP